MTRHPLLALVLSLLLATSPAMAACLPTMDGAERMSAAQGGHDRHRADRCALMLCCLLPAVRAEHQAVRPLQIGGRFEPGSPTYRSVSTALPYRPPWSDRATAMTHHPF
ncbi:hypothetical protein [Stutzerimonas urumqiensis]|uniref:hypothetical protein n=1 Tax=Stutzerimonas urumqiensis TaxID=638269 RepID=UPI000EB0F32D|nr:hypothetical protein [Stutzerimonas urumqiensis]